MKDHPNCTTRCRWSLGLEDLVNAQAALAKSRLDRQQAFDAADQSEEAAVELLKALLEKEADDRASACLDALTSKSWGLEAVEALLASDAVPPADQDISILTRALLWTPAIRNASHRGRSRFGTPIRS